MYKIEALDCYCATKVFEINGIKADSDDFGYMCDVDPDNAEPYGCGDMRFVPKPPSDDVLKEYNITKEEYNEICAELEEKLSFGCCGWCV